jgi:hypothetical protein
MKSAVLVFPGINRALARSLLVATALTAAGIGGVSAQPSPAPPTATPRPPVSVGGWRYEVRGADVHMFLCEQTACGAGSKVSYRLYAAGNPMTLEQFRDGQQQIVKALEERTPGQKITIIGVDGDKGTAVPRMFKARRLMVAPNGTSEYQVSGWLFGTRASATLISSAREEKTSNDNYAIFAVAVMLLLAPVAR